MKIKKFIGSLAFLIIASLLSCKDADYRKEKIIRSTDEEIDVERIECFTRNLLNSVTEQSFTISSIEPSLSTKNGLLITFSELETYKILKVRIKEYFSPSDFILNGLSTTMKNGLLESRGMLYIEIKDKEGREVENIDYVINTRKRKEITADFDLYYGYGDTIIEWQKSGRESLTFSDILDRDGNLIVRRQILSMFILTKQGWINFDREIPVISKRELLVEVDSTFSGVSYSLTSQKGDVVIKGRNISSSLINFGHLPADRDNLILVGYGETNESCYFGYLEINLSSYSDRTYLKLNEMSKPEVKKVLSNLYARKG